MAATFEQLAGEYGDQWEIFQAAGGWYALRRGFLSRAYLERRNLSNVICEQHLDGLARRLAEERAREAPSAPPAEGL
jgi:hypothetical protein